MAADGGNGLLMLWTLAALIAAGAGAGIWYSAQQGPAQGRDQGPAQGPDQGPAQGPAQERGGGDDRPRGIRNANPGNIRRTGTEWKGKAPEQNDPAYVQFEAPVWGIRALARTLETYRERHGLKSVAGIIGRWAPPNENATQAYIDHAAKALGVAPGEALEWTPDQVARLIETIIEHENGMQPYSRQLIRRGMQRA
jgi:hypothetical protein